MKRQTLRIISLITIAIILFTSCRQEQPLRIGVSQCSSDDWRDKMNEEIMREAMMLDRNIEIEIRSANDSNERQIEDLQYFIDNRFDLIAVAPNEAEALTPMVERIYAEGIPVVVFDRSVNTDSVTAFQGADNKAIGHHAANLAYNYCGRGAKILEITGLQGSSPAELRGEGFHEGADSLGLVIVAVAEGRWNYDDAARAVDSLLDIHPDIDLVHAHNDRMAIAASDVLSRRGLRPAVRVIGIDAAPEIGIDAVSKGKIDATFIYPTEGQTLVQTAVAILDGRPYPRFNLVPTPSAVDGSNADILLMQNRALTRETDKMTALRDRIDLYWHQHSIQTAMLYGALTIVVLLAVVIFLLLRAYWNHKRHRLEEEKRNVELERQRDELHDLYQRLEEATGSKLAFFTNVSHDLRTPLTLIADPVQQLAQATNLTPEQHTLMQLASTNVKRLLRLVNQILDIRRFDNGQLALDTVNLDLAAAMREWMAPFADAAARRHLRFSLEIAPDADYTAAIDPDKIERVLFNLLSNAFKFTPANGSVAVSMTRQDDYIIICVADSGIGIKPEEAQRVFDRFFHSSSAVNPNGSGIGLALSKTFVNMHQGDISVESKPGCGTTFRVAIPVRLLDAPVEQPRTSTDPASLVEELAPADDLACEVHEDAPTLLVIDDNPDICTLVRSVLGDEYTVLCAASGPQGIRMAARYIPDLIICDVMMPEMDGYDTCRRIKAEPVTSHIPVLLLTACATEEQRTAGYECGSDGYMSKPFDSAMLKARCRNLIENRKRVLSTGPTAAPKADTPLPRHDIDDEFYARFMQVIERDLGRSELSVEDVASELGLSRVQMYRKIKALTNYSPAEILRNTRLERAARLLKTTQRTVSEIAYEVGFSAPGYFAKCYKDYFNEAPTDTQSRFTRVQ